MTGGLHPSCIFRYSLKLGDSLSFLSFIHHMLLLSSLVTSITEMPFPLLRPVLTSSPTQSPQAPLWCAGLLPLSPTPSLVTFLKTTSDHVPPPLLKTPTTLSLSVTPLCDLVSPSLSSLCFCLSPHPPTQNLLLPPPAVASQQNQTKLLDLPDQTALLTIPS